MNKKFGFLYCLVFILAFMTTSCGNSDDDLVGNWVAISTDFGGQARAEASSFVIGTKLYIFGGYNGTLGKYYKDLWMLDTSSSSSGSTNIGSWTQLADLDSTATIIKSSTAKYARSSAVGFAIGTKGYIGTGYQGTSSILTDFWEYNPTSNTWTQLADYPGDARYGAYSFAVNSMGYVGGGWNGATYFADIYSYNPTTAAWTSVESVGKKRAYASTFVIDDVAYLVGGKSSSAAVTDFWAYNANSSTWTEKRQIYNATDDSFDDDYTTIARYGASTFVLNGKGYLTCGNSYSGSLMKYTWEYNPTDDTWTERTGFEHTVRAFAVGATVNSRGFVVAGRASSTYLDDINEFYPTADYNSYD